MGIKIPKLRERSSGIDSTEVGANVISEAERGELAQRDM